MIFPLEYHLQTIYYKLPDMEPELFNFNMTCFTDIKIVIKTSKISFFLFFFLILSMLYLFLSNNTTFDLYKHLLQITQKWTGPLLTAFRNLSTQLSSTIGFEGKLMYYTLADILLFFRKFEAEGSSLLL